jgi:isopentenyl diphosphate isomerase/L-lactate dehydrogenase-like FMN-dependent dehydrogenase
VGVPFALSTASTSLLEDVRAFTAGSLWMQLYVHKDRAVAEDLLRRARLAGYEVLLLAVDVPVVGSREGPSAMVAAAVQFHAAYYRRATPIRAGHS